MAKAKSTTEQGRDHENAMVKLFEFDQARRSKSSGAQPQDRIDVVGASFVMECESTNADSYTLKKEFWKEIRMKSGVRIPTLGVEFRDVDPKKSLQLVVLYADDFAEILERYES